MQRYKGINVCLKPSHRSLSLLPPIISKPAGTFFPRVEDSQPFRQEPSLSPEKQSNTDKQFLARIQRIRKQGATVSEPQIGRDDQTFDRSFPPDIPFGQTKTKDVDVDFNSSQDLRSNSKRPISTTNRIPLINDHLADQKHSTGRIDETFNHKVTPYLPSRFIFCIFKNIYKCLAQLNPIYNLIHTLLKLKQINSQIISIPLHYSIYLTTVGSDFFHEFQEMYFGQKILN